MQFGPFRSCVQVHWCKYSLGKFPMSLLHSFASQQCVLSYLFLLGVQIERGIKIEGAQPISCRAATLLCSAVISWRVWMKHPLWDRTELRKSVQPVWVGLRRATERKSTLVKMQALPLPLSSANTRPNLLPTSLPQPSHTPAVTQRWYLRKTQITAHE